MENEVKTLNVEGMSCSHCENSVKKAVGALEGVASVEVDLEGNKVTIKFDPSKINLDKIKGAIEDQGYDIN